MTQSTTENIENNPIGAAMVVGGGIAGMQASLDLADQGFKVYMIEKNSAIGGKMAQLDKTFPTNDCAMCTISPKLAEVGRHPNIDILTNTEVRNISGTAGDFMVMVQHHPRFIDTERCVACGDCVDVCPVSVYDDFNEGLVSRQAVYKLYPQAVPNAFAIEKRGIAPCRHACPAGQRAQGYIALTREARWKDALRVIKLDNPFPGICGRICNHRCESECNRGLVDEPVNIRALKRFITDKVYQEPREPVATVPRIFDQQIAIIGAGPCGLTAAQDLVMAGYGVTVFEAMSVAGGMLRLGVPEYRLPTEIIEREVQDIVDLGVDLRLNHRIDDLDELPGMGYDAVLISVGAHEGIRLPIPGADLNGVLINTHFLRDVQLGKYENNGQDNRRLGERVLILGGGNVAIDCARSAVRLGCEVHLACLESRVEMPAHKWEVDAAEEEGVHMHPGRTFEKILSDQDEHVRGVECLQVESFSFDDSGCLQVEKIPNSKHTIPCDTVIFSVGQRAGLAFLPDDAGIGLTKNRLIAIDADTFATSREGIFAAGDSVSGTTFVIEAVANGHRAAESIIHFLRGEIFEPNSEPEQPVAWMTKQEIVGRIVKGEIKYTPRIPLPELTLDQRKNSFAEIEIGYSEESARLEASRCLECGICSECMSCVYACGRDAINHEDFGWEQELEVGAVILVPGYQIYNAQLSEEYGLGRFPNVVTSLQYERLLSASGPTKGHILRPSDKVGPKRVAFLQCVGSRDQSHDYCSSVCCMYAAKEAIMTMEHARAEARGGDGEIGVSCRVFFMDTRAYSKGYEQYYRRAEHKYGIDYIRCRLSDIKEDPKTKNLLVRYSNPYAGDNKVIEEEFDMVVLSVGMEISDSVKELGNNLGIELDPYGFCHTTLFDPLQTSRSGIYVAGPFREPKDIPETVIEASGAAASVSKLLAPSRHTLAQKLEYPLERNISEEEARIGVFVCHCGTNIGGYLDVPQVSEYALSLPGVVYADDNLYTCSQDSIAHIIEQVKEQNLNRVVVSACTPLTHEPLFQDAIRQAGLNPYLFEMANIRNQCSWVHSNDWDSATSKAKSLTRMAVARAAKLEPLKVSEVPVNNSALIIGGGAAGMTAALTLAEQGFPVHLVERDEALGGNLRHLRYFVTENGKQHKWTPSEFLADISERVSEHPDITVHLNSELTKTGGFKGNFTSTLKQENKNISVEHGVVIVTTGGKEYKGKEYGYGSSQNIVTQLEFEGLLAEIQAANYAEFVDLEKQFPDPDRQVLKGNLSSKFLHKKQRGNWSGPNPDTPELKGDLSSKFLHKKQRGNLLGPNSVVMIQCVGPGEKYCSRICCITALKNALKLKEINPNAQVTILYRDIRTYGFKERLYTQARAVGVQFVHYEFDRKPEVDIVDGNDGASQVIESAIKVRIKEPTLGRDLLLNPDLLVLSTPVIPSAGTRELASQLKLSIDMDGFFLEAHVKLRPVDFTADGIFMAGMAHYPKFLDETIAQAQAAASRAASILSQKTMLTNARVAIVDPEKCVGCLTCVRVCPYDVPAITADHKGVGNILGAAYIQPAICHGCGSCASECPAQAIQLMHYTDAQTMTKVDALFDQMSFERLTDLPVKMETS